MKKKILLGSLGFASAIVFTGCAGMFSGSTQQLTIKSNVDGATVEMNGRVIGQTPVSIRLPYIHLLHQSTFKYLVA